PPQRLGFGRVYRPPQTVRPLVHESNGLSKFVVATRAHVRAGYATRRTDGHKLVHAERCEMRVVIVLEGSAFGSEHGGFYRFELDLNADCAEVLRDRFEQVGQLREITKAAGIQHRVRQWVAWPVSGVR